MNVKNNRRRVLITGLANSGKTTLCNRLTGTYNLVANYPMTTVEPMTEQYSFQGVAYSVTDMPGMNGFQANSEEELVFRKTVAGEGPLKDGPELIVQCIDANRLKQSLFFTSQLMLIGLPLVICLTAVDETARTGRKIDTGKLSAILGVPVVETGISGKWGVYDVKEAIADAMVMGEKQEASRPKIYSPEMLEHIQRIGAVTGLAPVWHRLCAVLCLTGDYYMEVHSDECDYRHWGIPTDKRLAMLGLRAIAENRIQGNPAARIIRERGKWTDSVFGSVVRQYRADPGWLSGRIAYISRHPVWGLLFLAVVLGIAYVLVVNGAGKLAEILDHAVTGPTVGFIREVIGPPFWEDLLVGDYGILTLGLFNALVTVLPILSVFFLLLGFLEDIGYLPNVSVLLRRFFSRLGLSGKAVMPMILGFGCKTMATMTTRSLKSRKERLIAIFLIAFAIPCSAQMGLNLAILGRAGIFAFVLAGTVLVLVELLAGAVLNKVITSDIRQVFIQELPPFRRPDPWQIVKKTAYRVWWFLKEAIPIFVIAAVILFFVDLTGFLGVLRQFLRPLVVTWLGLPIQMVDALILMLAREEAAAGLILQLSQAGMLNFIQSVTAVVVTTMFVPCFANIVAMFKEAGAKAAVLMLIGINLSTILLGGLLNWVALWIQSLAG